MILSGIHDFKIWIPDYTLGNDNLRCYCETSQINLYNNKIYYVFIHKKNTAAA